MCWFEIGAKRTSVRVEMVEARSHAHGMMPGDRESPPNQSAKNPLPYGEREDIPLFREKPGHQNSANPCDRHKDGIRPVEQGEERAGDERNAHGVVNGRAETVRDERIQADLLQQAERHVAKEAPGNKKRPDGPVRAPEKKSRNDNCENTRQKDGGRAFGGGPEIIRAPAKRLRGVLV